MAVKPKSLKTWLSQLDYEISTDSFWQHANVGTTFWTDESQQIAKYNVICSKCGQNHSGVGAGKMSRFGYIDVDSIVCPSCGIAGFIPQERGYDVGRVFVAFSLDIPDNCGGPGVVYGLVLKSLKRSFTPLLSITPTGQPSGVFIIPGKDVYFFQGGPVRRADRTRHIQYIREIVGEGVRETFYMDERAKKFFEDNGFQPQTRSAWLPTPFATYIEAMLAAIQKDEIFSDFDVAWPTISGDIYEAIKVFRAENPYVNYLVLYSVSPSGYFAVQKFGSDGERGRAVLSPSRCEFARREDTHQSLLWKKEEWCSSGGDALFALLQSKEEIISLLRTSSLARTGIIEALELTEEGVPPYRVINYVKAYREAPILESVAKCGLVSIIKHVFNGGDCPVVNLGARSVIEALGLTKSMFDYLRKLEAQGKGSIDLYLGISSWRKIDNTLSLEDVVSVIETFEMCGYEMREYLFDKICAIARRDVTVAANPKQKAMYSAHRIASYLRSLVTSQCIDPVEGLNEWKDYLGMLELLEADMLDSSIVYPASLKLEHDRASYKYEAVKDQKEAKAFARATRQYSWLEYQDESEEYIVRIPESAEEMFEEHRVLGHCVHSYVKYVAKRETCVAFIRQKNKPDVPYCTIEVKDGSIMQAQGKANRFPRDPNLSMFVKRFAAKKNLKIKCSVG